MKPVDLRCMVGAVATAVALFPPVAADPIPPLPPQGFHGTYDAANRTVTLSWQAPDADHAYHYVLHRGSTFLADVDGLTYADTPPANLTTLYTIQAVRPADGTGWSSSERSSPPVGWLAITCDPAGVVIGGPSIVTPWVHPECLL